MLEEKTRWIKFIFGVLFAFMVCALAIYGYLGIFTRYMADDYSTAGILVDKGFWGAQQYWWNNWSGRYSFTFVVSFVELFGLQLVPVLPSLVIAIWLLSIILACSPFLKRLNFKNPIVVSAFAAVVVLWVTYRGIEDYPQIVFWQTGILTYPISPITLLLGVGMIVRRSSIATQINLRELFLWFLFAFFAGGFSETGVVLQIVLSGALLLILFIMRANKPKVYYPVLLASFVGSIVSLLVISIAPGNLIRSGGFKGIPFWGDSLLGSLKETWLFIPSIADRYTLVYVFCFVAGIFLIHVFLPKDVSVSNLSLAKGLVVSLLIAGTGIWAGILPAYALRGAVPPERALLLPYFLVACLVLICGAEFALFFRFIMPKSMFVPFQWISLTLLAVFMYLSVVPFFVSQFQLISPLKEYSARWDERHSALTSTSKSGDSVVVVSDFSRIPSLRKLRTKLWISGDFETIADHWVNQAAALYYGVGQIVAK